MLIGIGATAYHRQNILAQILGGAEVWLPITHTAVPQRGSITPTFTRATTATGQKWDEAGYLDFTALAGEMVFKGARREYNPLPSSENLTVGFTATGSTLAAGSITESGASSGHYAQTTSMVVPTNAVFQMQAEIKQSVGTRNIGIGTNSVGNAIFNPSTGVFVANDGATLDHGTIEQTADGYWRVWVKVQATTSNKPIISMYSGTTQSYAGDGVSQVLVRKYQLNDITGETDQTTIRPYVSVGVPSDWAGTDLVTNGDFSDGTTGWTTSDSTFTASGGQATLTATSNTADACWAWTTFTTVSGTKYVLSADLTGGTGYTARYLRVGTFNTSGGLANPSVTTDGKYIVEFTATGTTTYISLGVYDVNYPTTPGTAVWDNISVKPAAYHGSMVDGVKCYDTDRSGNPISTSGSYPLVGYVPWEARTNLLLQSAVVATQSITVAAVAHTLSFKGTGTITLSGVSAAGPLVGTGANDRVTLTFTPTAGSLTLTVSGSCTVGQLEAGSFATPYIPTTTVAVARNANLLTYSNTGTISASEGTVYAELSTAYTVASGYKDAISSAAGTGAQILGIGNAAASTTRFTIDGSTLTTKSGLSDMSTGTRKTAVTWGGSTYSITGDGVAPTSAAFDGSMTVTASFGVGCNAAGTGQWNGNVRNVRIWNRKLSASELQAITA